MPGITACGNEAYSDLFYVSGKFLFLLILVSRGSAGVSLSLLSTPWFLLSISYAGG